MKVLKNHFFSLSLQQEISNRYGKQFRFFGQKNPQTHF